MRPRVLHPHDVRAATERRDEKEDTRAVTRRHRPQKQSRLRPRLLHLHHPPSSVQPRRSSHAPGDDPRDVMIRFIRHPVIPHHVSARFFIYIHHRARVDDPYEHEERQHVIRHQEFLIPPVQRRQSEHREHHHQRPHHRRRRPGIFKQRIVQPTVREDHRDALPTVPRAQNHEHESQDHEREVGERQRAERDERTRVHRSVVIARASSHRRRSSGRHHRARVTVSGHRVSGPFPSPSAHSGRRDVWCSRASTTGRRQTAPRRRHARG